MKHLDRWQANAGKGRKPSKDEVLVIGKSSTPTASTWRLPPSKSHLIRWTLVAAQSEEVTTLLGTKGAGDDALSMARCLTQLGVQIEVDENSWTVQGVGQFGFTRPHTLLNCGNSGTTLRLLTGLCARFSFPVMLDGDNTLRHRGNDALWSALQECGVELSFGKGAETLPLIMRGPWHPTTLQISTSDSSQPLSAIRLGAIGAKQPFSIKLGDYSVSRRHLELSDQIARKSGSNDSLNLNDDDNITLSPWKPNIASQITIPADASHAAFALLFTKLHNVSLTIPNMPEDEDCLGHEILSAEAGSLGLSWDSSADKIKISSAPDAEKYVEIDLRDANDLITPLGSLLAISGGGKIVGASHAANKESNRITKTVELLAAFGISCSHDADGIEVSGGQFPSQPAKVVNCHNDHRLQMSAVILASAVGGVIRGSNLHEVSYPNFLESISKSGISYEKRVQSIE